MKGKRFDSEFKKDIVKLYINGERTCPSLAEELGLHENTIYKWIQQYNVERPHSGKYCYGKTPMETFKDSLSLAKEKLLNYNCQTVGA